MAKMRITNEMLARDYMKDVSMLGYGPKQKAIFNGIKECKPSFYDYYLKHHGKLGGLYYEGKCENVSLNTLSLLEIFIGERTGNAKNEEASEPIKNISARLFKIRPGPHPIR